MHALNTVSSTSMFADVFGGKWLGSNCFRSAYVTRNIGF